eukprot:gene18803-22464_t
MKVLEGLGANIEPALNIVYSQDVAGFERAESVLLKALQKGLVGRRAVAHLYNQQGRWSDVVKLFDGGQVGVADDTLPFEMGPVESPYLENLALVTPLLQLGQTVRAERLLHQIREGACKLTDDDSKKYEILMEYVHKASNWWLGSLDWEQLRADSQTILNVVLSEDSSCYGSAALDVTTEEVVRRLKAQARGVRHEELADDPRALAASAYAFLALRSWLQQKYSEASNLAAAAMDLEGWSSSFWPLYCPMWANAVREGKTDDQSPAARRWIKPWLAEREFLKGQPGALGNLSRAVSYLRELECSDDFIHEQLRRVYTYHHTECPKQRRSREGAAESRRDATPSCATYSFDTFNYGTLYYQGFTKIHKHNTVKTRLQKTAELDLDYIFLGSNTGNELMYAAATYGVRVVGYDLLCPLVEIGQSVASREFADLVASKRISFHCQDALFADLSRAGLVYVDDCDWDLSVRRALWEKLKDEVPLGTVVVSWGMHAMPTERSTRKAKMKIVKKLTVVESSWGFQDEEESNTVLIEHLVEA